MPVKVKDQNDALNPFPMSGALEAAGIDKETLAKLAKEGSEALKPVHIKIKGWVPVWQELPEGYMVVSSTSEETVLRFDFPDGKLRDSVRRDVHKLLGHYPKGSDEDVTPLGKLIGGVLGEIMNKDKGKLPSDVGD